MRTVWRSERCVRFRTLQHCPVRLPQPHSGPAAIVRDELDAGKIRERGEARPGCLQLAFACRIRNPGWSKRLCRKLRQAGIATNLVGLGRLWTAEDSIMESTILDARYFRQRHIFKFADGHDRSIRCACGAANPFFLDGEQDAGDAPELSRYEQLSGRYSGNLERVGQLPHRWRDFVSLGTPRLW